MKQRPWFLFVYVFSVPLKATFIAVFFFFIACDVKCRVVVVQCLGVLCHGVGFVCMILWIIIKYLRKPRSAYPGASVEK